jgi:hypothetical protein
MGTPIFSPLKDFPSNRVYLKGGKEFWKIDVKEWAFGTLVATDVDQALNIGSNNPTVVPGFFETSSTKKITYTPDQFGAKEGLVRFYAKSEGFTYVNFFRPPSFDAVGVILQVHVILRRSQTATDSQLTKLNGKTFALNAPDAISYEMDKTVISKTSDEGKDGGVFAKVEKGTNHVVIGSHATLEGRNPDPKTICLWSDGERKSFRVNTGNVDSVFGVLKGKVADNCVIWIGGCTMSQNDTWCKSAAKASGCHLVACANLMPNQKFPKGTVDMLDRTLMPAVYPPDGGVPIDKSEFCAQQEKFQFVVPP